LLESFNNCTSLFKLLLFTEYEEKKQQEHSYRSLNFSRRSTTKCGAKPVGKILDKLAIVFEAATAFKAAFYSLFNFNLFKLQRSENTRQRSDLFTSEDYSLFLSPLPQD